MRIPPGYTQKQWDALSLDEKKAIWLVVENKKLVREVKKIISVVPREVLLTGYATILCSMSAFDRAKAIDTAYGLLNRVDKYLEHDDGEDE